MSWTLELLETMREHFAQENWQALNAGIAYESALKGEHPELSHFKVVAMSRLEQERCTDAFLKLVKARLVHQAHRGLYLQLQADTLMQMERFAEAISPIQKLCALYEGNPHLYERLVVCADKLGDQDLFHQALGRYRYSLAVQEAQKLDFAAAANLLWESVQRVGHDQRAPWLLAKSLSYCREYEKAEQIWQLGWQELDDGDPLREDIQRDRLQQALRTGKTELTQELAEQLLDHHADDVEALRSLALVREQEGELLSAIGLYHRILEHYPYDVLASLKAIFLANQMVEHQQAGLTPLDDGSRILIAKVFVHAGYDAAAMAMLEAVKRASPCYREAKLLQVERIMVAREYERALELLEIELAESEEDDMFLAMAAESQCCLGNYAVAEALADRASWIDYDNKRAQFWLAESRYQQFNSGIEMDTEQLLNIINSYEDYGDHNPGDGFPYMRIADLYLCMGDYWQIEANINEARDRGHISSRASYLMGRYWQFKKRYEAAVKEYSYAIELNDGQGYFSVWVQRAECYLELGKHAEARQDLMGLMQQWPDHEAVVALKARILELCVD